jgi:hypothetical protein
MYIDSETVNKIKEEQHLKDFENLTCYSIKYFEGLLSL